MTFCSCPGCLLNRRLGALLVAGTGAPAALLRTRSPTSDRQVQSAAVALVRHEVPHEAQDIDGAQAQEEQVVHVHRRRGCPQDLELRTDRGKVVARHLVFIVIGA